MGAVSITDQAHQKQDISTLNRDTETSLHQLEKIFDKKKIQERRELVSEFAKLGAEKIGDIAKEKNWAEDDYRRTLLHGLLGALTAQMSGNSALAGGAAGAATERLQPVLDKLLKDYPELREDAGSVIGYAVGKALNDGKTGEAVAWNGTKFNWLSHKQMQEYRDKLKEAEENGNTDEVEYYKKKIELQDTYAENLLKDYIIDHPDIGKIDGKPFVIMGVNASGVLVARANIPLDVKNMIEEKAQQKIDEVMGKDYYDYKGMEAFSGWSSLRNWGIAESAGLPWELTKDQTNAPGWSKVLGKYSVIGSAVNGTMNITQDFRDYSGKDRYLAIGADVIGIGLGVGIGTISFGGGIISAGASIGINYYIDNFVLKYKLMNTQTDKEKYREKQLNDFKESAK